MVTWDRARGRPLVPEREISLSTPLTARCVDGVARRTLIVAEHPVNGLGRASRRPGPNRNRRPSADVVAPRLGGLEGSVVVGVANPDLLVWEIERPITRG